MEPIDYMAPLFGAQVALIIELWLVVAMRGLELEIVFVSSHIRSGSYLALYLLYFIKY